MNELVSFLQELTGKAIDVAPEAINGLVAMNAAYFSSFLPILIIISPIFIAIIVLGCILIANMDEKTWEDHPWPILLVSFGSVALLVIIIVFIDTFVKYRMFSAAPEIFVIKDLLNI